MKPLKISWPHSTHKLFISQESNIEKLVGVAILPLLSCPPENCHFMSYNKIYYMFLHMTLLNYYDLVCTSRYHIIRPFYPLCLNSRWNKQQSPRKQNLNHNSTLSNGRVICHLDGKMQKFSRRESQSRDIHIECSKQFKWNLYFYGSGQSGPFLEELKLP